MRRFIIALNSPIICRIFIYLAVPLLQSVTSLNDQNQKRMQSKLTEVTWLYQPFFHLYLFQVFSSQIFRETYQVNNCWLNLFMDQNQFEKNSCHKLELRKKKSSVIVYLFSRPPDNVA